MNHRFKLPRHMMIRPFLYLAISLLLPTSVLLAQPGSVDPTFDPGEGPNARVFVTTVQPDGKVLIAGDFTEVSGQAHRRIARLNADGSLDASFNANAGPDVFAVFCITVQPDGKILLGGQFEAFNGTEHSMITRLNANGTVDNSFDPGAGADWIVSTIAVQPDGKILVGGNFTSFDGTARTGITRLNSNGAQDPSFDPGTGLGSIGIVTDIYAFALESDGRITIAGSFNSYNGTDRNSIARLNSNGELDTSFDPGSGAEFGSINCMVRQVDGKLVIGGSFTDYNGTDQPFLARVTNSGALDPTFNVGASTSGSILAMALQPDGRILLGGFFYDYNELLARDVARVNTDGSLDLNWSTGTGSFGIDAGVYDMALQADGSLIVGGQFSAYNGSTRNKVARLNGGTGTPVSEIQGASRLHVWSDDENQLLRVSEPVSGQVFDMEGRVVVTFNRTNAIAVDHLCAGAFLLRTESGTVHRFVRP
ncbi:MAG: delta-60 repeat domain-containing protein [Flavobacteriales bacterium]|nr:delta-60 repeat domain-containing protein [Flavobacteriales bacterium]